MMNTNPLGFCPICRRPKMERTTAEGAKEKFCPAHGVNPEPPSKAINLETDPGADAEILKEATVMPTQVVTKVVRMIVPVPVQVLAHSLAGSVVDVGLTVEQAKMCLDHLSAVPAPASMKETRQLVKLMDELERIIGGL